MKTPATLEQIPIILKKSTPQKVALSYPINYLDNYKFKIVHSVSSPLTFRFTFYDEAESKSVYIALDIKSGETFEFYSVATDRMKTFTQLEIYCDVNVQLGLSIELQHEKLEKQKQ
jgi:hypothetical protein